ncbi:MAG: phosphatase PAP2 family protein [Acidobacteriota bacterium]
MKLLLPISFLSLALATSAQEAPQPQSNPAAQSNLPNAPSSIVTGKPHGQGQVPLEDVPHPPVTIAHLPLNIVGDTYRIVTAPIYIRTRDLYWILPLTAASAVSFSQDTHVARDVVSHNVDFNNTAGTISNDVRDSFIAAPIALIGVGQFTHNDHAREAGLLGGEAIVDASIFDQLVKLSTFRERPNVDNGAGDFYRTSAGIDSSFISGHAMVSWSSAAVLAAYYPKPWQQAIIYTAAGSVSVNRVLAEQHFPTDVLIGSAAGWLIGHYVVRAHHHHPVFRHHSHQPEPATL